MNIPFLKSIFGPANYLGVDIGTTSIKIVDIAKTSAGKKPRLKNYGFLESYGHLERLNNAIQTSSLKMMDKDTAELLKMLLGHLKSNTKEAVASLPTFLAFITLLEVPIMTEGETGQAMQYQARQYVPIPISEVSIDWIKVGEREDEQGVKKQQILLVSVPNDYIRKYQNIFKMAGLKLVALEIEGMSMTRSLIAGDPTATLIVDIGARSTSISVADKGFLKMSNQTDFSGGSLTNALAGSLGISTRRAENLKKQRGLSGSGGEYELSTILLPFLDAIIGEVKRVQSIYETNYSGKIERVILAGGGANLLGIEKYFEEQFGLPTVKADPFRMVSYAPEIEPLARTLGSSFSVAIGLGIKHFV
mgnify:FL=1